METFKGEYECKLVINRVTNEIYEFLGWDSSGWAWIDNGRSDSFAVHYACFRNCFIPYK